MFRLILPWVLILQFQIMVHAGSPVVKYSPPGDSAMTGSEVRVTPSLRTVPKLPAKSEIIAIGEKVNDYWIANHSNPGNNEWTRATYFVGNLEFYKVSEKQSYLDYALRWANNNNWGLNGGVTTTHADNHAAGQVYLDLYMMDEMKDLSRISVIRNSIDNMIINNPGSDKWWWIDAMFMAMPTITRLGVVTNDTKYFDKLYALFHNTKDTLLVNPETSYWPQAYRDQYGVGPIVTCPTCGNASDGLYNKADGLWWRDWGYQPGVPPKRSPFDGYRTDVAKLSPNGKNIYWSRGNGWAFAALARTLQFLPATDAHYHEYVEVFAEMAEALKNCQRPDGFWNMNLGDPDHYPAPETSGTGFFAFGLAWGINNGFLNRDTYYPVVAKAWNGLSTIAILPNGNVGNIQGVGEYPRDPSVLTTAIDYAVGIVLLAATEVSKLADLEDKDILLDRSDWTIICSSIGPVDEAVAPQGDFPEYIIDGDTRSAFLFVKPGVTHGGVTVPDDGSKPWFAIDLKKACDMTYLLYRHRDYNNTLARLRATKGSFYGKNNEEDEFQSIMENFDIATDITEIRIDFPEKVSYRYVKFVLEDWDASNGNTIQVSEFNLGNTLSPDATGIHPPVWNDSAYPQVIAYPNPVKAGQPFTICLADELAGAVIRICSVSGIKLVELKATGNFVEQTIYYQGVYIILVRKENAKTYTFKVVVY